MIIKGTSGFTSNTLLIRNSILLSVYIVYRMHKMNNEIRKWNVKIKEVIQNKHDVYPRGSEDIIQNKLC